MTIGVLGPLQVDDHDVRLGGRDRVVLAALAMRVGEALSAEQIADAVWGPEPPPTWGKALQGCVSRLRRVLGREAIETTAQGYRLTIPIEDVDAPRFERTVQRANELVELGEPDRAAFLASRALALWRGRPLVELEDWAPGHQEADRLEEVRLGAEELALEAALRSGHHVEVLARAKEMTTVAPLRERRWCLLALAQYRSGRQAEALAALQALRGLLADQLGLDPSTEVLTLEHAILHHSPELDLEPSRVVVSEQCPWPGLLPFGEADAESFCGRDAEVARCLAGLAADGVVVVVGPSGSGKSSLVRAGLAAALRRQGRPVEVVVPGPRPFQTLQQPMRTPSRPALVVDQAEELFTVCEDAEERTRFLDALVGYAEGAPVVLALRADRTGEVAVHPSLARLVERGLFLLGPMSAENLRLAVEVPARSAGVIVEPGLTDLLVREVEGETGALPLLSHSLRETWLRREGRTLTVAGYQASGGVRGAVAKSAEDLYRRVPDRSRVLLKDLMLRLVAPGAEGEPVRARMPRRTLVADPAQGELVDLLVAARLVTSEEGVLEIAHESLARAWPRLKGWLEDDVEGRKVLHHLVAAADAWDALGRPESELYRGVRLSQALEWRNRTSPELTPVERDFLHVSLAATDAEAFAVAARARAQARMIRRLRLALVTVVAALVLALGAGYLAADQGRRADRENHRAQRAARAADARGAGATAVSTADLVRAVPLAVKAVRLDDSATTRTDLLAVLMRFPELVRSSDPMDSAIVRIDASADGRLAAAYDANNEVLLLETANLIRVGLRDVDGLHTIDPQVTPTGPLAFSPDGSMLAIGAQTYDARAVTLVDGHTLHELPGQLGHLPRDRAKVVDVAWSADGHHLAVSFLDDPLGVRSRSGEGDSPTSADVRVWDLSRPARPPAVVPLDPSVWDTVRLSPNGSTVYTSGPAAAYAVSTGTRSWVRPDLLSSRPLDLSPDGRRLAVTSAGTDPVVRPSDRAYVLDAATGRTVRVLRGDPVPVTALRFSPRGDLVATVAGPRTWVWRLSTGTPVRVLRTGRVADVDFDRTASSLFLGREDGTVQTWDLRGDRSWPRHDPTAYPGFTHAGITFAPDARRLSFDEHHHGVGLLDARTGRRSGLLVGVPGLQAPRADGWSRDGHSFITAGARGLVQVWSSAGRLRRERHAVPGDVTAVAADPRDGRLAVAESTGRVDVLDPTTLERAGPTARVSGRPCCLSVDSSHHTAFLLVGRSVLRRGEEPAYDGWAMVDLRGKDPLRQGRLRYDATRAAVSPDGTRVAVGSARSVQLLDGSTGEPLGPVRSEHDGDVTSLSWSSDGSSVVSGSTKGEVVVWDGRTGRLVERLVIADPPVPVFPAFRTDGTVFVASAGGETWVWDPSVEAALYRACRYPGDGGIPYQEFGFHPYALSC